MMHRSQGLRTHMLSAVMAAALAGCAVGPDFRPPEPPDVTQYTPGKPLAKTVTAVTEFGNQQRLVEGLPVESQWWRHLGSTALNELVEEAFRSSPTLAAANATLR